MGAQVGRPPFGPFARVSEFNLTDLVFGFPYKFCITIYVARFLRVRS